MAPLSPEHYVYGSYTLKNGKLTFTAGSGQLVYYARQAKDAGRDFTVILTPPDGLKEVTGQVLSVELLERVMPLRYAVVMKVKDG